MTQRVTGQRFRQRKLSTKQNLSVLRESDVESLADDEAQRHVPRVETGVEKAEETEHHLQAVISAAQASAVGGKVAQLYIPTPETVHSNVQYEQLYPKTFAQPATYIRFSSTVEDCNGCPYTMDSEDFGFKKVMNQKRGKTGLCTDDDFEVVMNFFEETATAKQPFAAIDSTPVLTFEEMESNFDDTIDENARHFAKDIYEHWKSRRMAKGNSSFLPSLKFETNLDTDDADPYVCFRRREVRQVRKTRGRDAQVTEKLKKMRKELEEARWLVYNVLQREKLRYTALGKAKQLYEQRRDAKQQKRKLGIKTTEDDVDFIDQKPAPKPKPRLEAPVVRGVPGLGPKTPLPAADSRPDTGMILLSDKRAKSEAVIKNTIEDNIAKHIAWNENYVDATWRPITPPLEQIPKSSFRPAAVEFLPTPPTSVEGEGDSNGPGSRSRTPNKPEPFVVKYEPQKWSEDGLGHDQKPSFRRRMGRGGRQMIDRRSIKRERNEVLSPIPISPKRQKSGYATDEELYNQLLHTMTEASLREADRHKYDRDSDDDEEMCAIDTYSMTHMRGRVAMEIQFKSRQMHEAANREAAHRRSLDGAQSQLQLQRRPSSGQQNVPPAG